MTHTNNETQTQMRRSQRRYMEILTQKLSHCAPAEQWKLFCCVCHSKQQQSIHPHALLRVSRPHSPASHKSPQQTMEITMYLLVLARCRCATTPSTLCGCVCARECARLARCAADSTTQKLELSQSDCSVWLWLRQQLNKGCRPLSVARPHRGFTFPLCYCASFSWWLLSWSRIVALVRCTPTKKNRRGHRGTLSFAQGKNSFCPRIGWDCAPTKFTRGAKICVNRYSKNFAWNLLSTIANLRGNEVWPTNVAHKYRYHTVQTGKQRKRTTADTRRVVCVCACVERLLGRSAY